MTVQKRNAALVGNLRADLVDRFNPATAWGNIVATHLSLNGLRGFWPASSRDENDNVIDVSGQGRTLTNNGTTPFVLSGLRVYGDFNGSSQYLSRASEAGLAITGELAMGCWFYLGATPGSNGAVIGKYGAAGNRGYILRVTNVPAVEFTVSGNGTNEFSATSAAITTGRWYFVAARYRPSAEVAVFVNRTRVSNTTSIPAAIFASTAAFEIAANNGAANFLDCFACLGWLCGSSLYGGTDAPDTVANTLYDLSRPLFAVRDV